MLTILLILSLGKPDSPKGPLKAIDIDKTAVTLEWQPPASDGGSPLTGYVVEMKNALGKWVKVDSVEPDVTQLRVPNLTEGQDYHFRVIAENKAGASKPLATLAAIVPKSKFGEL